MTSGGAALERAGGRAADHRVLRVRRRRQDDHGRCGGPQGGAAGPQDRGRHHRPGQTAGRRPGPRRAQRRAQPHRRRLGRRAVGDDARHQAHVRRAGHPSTPPTPRRPERILAQRLLSQHLRGPVGHPGVHGDGEALRAAREPSTTTWSWWTPRRPGTRWISCTRPRAGCRGSWSTGCSGCWSRRRAGSSAAPYVGFMPTIPHSEAGRRIEPPVSVPIAHGAVPAATAAALPPLDPPGTSRGPTGSAPARSRSSRSRSPSRTRPGSSCRARARRRSAGCARSWPCTAAGIPRGCASRPCSARPRRRRGPSRRSAAACRRPRAPRRPPTGRSRGRQRPRARARTRTPRSTRSRRPRCARPAAPRSGSSSSSLTRHLGSAPGSRRRPRPGPARAPSHATARAAARPRAARW